MPFVRFVVSYRDKCSTHRSGVFQAAFDLEDAGVLAEYEELQLLETGKWFDKNLAKPAKFSRKRNSYHRNSQGISWFKDSATEHLTKIHEIVALLHEHGVQVDRLVSERPGYIVYEDEHQVVAEPFSDTVK